MNSDEIEFPGLIRLRNADGESAFASGVPLWIGRENAEFRECPVDVVAISPVQGWVKFFRLNVSPLTVISAVIASHVLLLCSSPGVVCRATPRSDDSSDTPIRNSSRSSLRVLPLIWRPGMLKL